MMTMRRLAVPVLSILLLLTLTSCIFSKQAGSAWVAPTFRPSAEASCLLGAIPDGGGADGVIGGSGELVRSKVRTELLKHGLAVSSASSSDLQPLLEEGRKASAAYVVLGRIPIWEDNATEWSGKRDHAGVSLEMYEVATGKLVATAERTADGVRTPSECAPWLAESTVRALFGEPTDATSGPPC